MPLYRQQAISAEKLLTISINLLHQAFGDTTRLLAKRRFQYLENGKSVYLATVRMEDGSELKVNVKLDHSELKGKLNFGSFRQLAAQLTGACVRELESGQALNIFSEQDEKRWVYLTPALYQNETALNMLVLGANLRQPGELTIELMFVDPEQFKQKPTFKPEEAPVQS
jgi:hypothetical protein